MSDLHVLASGIDSLYFTAQGLLRPGTVAHFEDLQEQARLAREAAAVTLDNFGNFLVHARGRREFDLWLQSGAFELGLCSNEGRPDASVQLHSIFIHLVGIELAVVHAERFLSEYVFDGACTGKVSRVDVFADVQGWEPELDDLHRFVTRARSKRAYQQLHVRGRRLSGFVFGHRDVVGRIYDKTLQIAVTGDSWPEMLWRDRDHEHPVWRVEFQFRRKALASFRIDTPQDSLDRRQALWDYGTRWLSLRVPQRADSNVWRWPEAPAWLALRAAPMGSPHTDLVRARQRSDDELRLVRGLVGYASSLAAMGAAAGVGDAVIEKVPAVRAYVQRRGGSFEALVARKRRRRLGLPEPVS